MRSSFLSLTHLQAHQPRVTAFNSIYRTLNKTTIVGMPHATAKVDGITIADTDNYEVVEGNIYVSHRSGTPSLLPNLCPFDMMSNVLTPSLKVPALVSLPPHLLFRPKSRSYVMPAEADAAQSLNPTSNRPRLPALVRGRALLHTILSRLMERS